ncbi:MAG: hypothetical protein H0U53_03110, partial [Actinobacteria bacterium]|nr:hypothetical protein [Actinomycetota bacterium]
PNVPALDVLSADFATAGSSFGVVVRVDDIPELPVDPNSPAGHEWFVLFSVGERTFFVDARSSATGDAIYLYEQEPFPGSGKLIGALDGVIDRTRDEVRIWGLLSLLGAAEDVRKGTPVLVLEVLSARFVGVTAAGSRDPLAFPVHADFTDPGRTYTIGRPSCVKVGS